MRIAGQKQANTPDIKSKAQVIRAEAGVEFLGLAVERLDYTKGILERVRAVELFLQENPNYQGRFTLLQIAAPSRTGIDQYRKYREQVEREIHRVNDRFGNEVWKPIQCRYETVPRENLSAYYQAADLMCILPLRDGMNLVTKEYVASCLECNGAILLSNKAGVAEEFGDYVLLVNPFDTKAVAKALKQGLELDPVTRATKMAQLREKVGHQDLNWWLQRHLDEIGAFLLEDRTDSGTHIACHS
ncbi:MAG: trehalose-6-phosphate synthase [Prochloraceae cyanobacterium]|nr:trehalose-6-phosphate synthase [Prochloraceae cyanobacterium]